MRNLITTSETFDKERKKERERETKKISGFGYINTTTVIIENS